MRYSAPFLLQNYIIVCNSERKYALTRRDSYSEIDVAGRHFLIEKDGGRLTKLIGTLGGKELTATILRQPLLYIGMPLQIALQTVRHDATLRYYANLWWHILPDFINQQRIMGTAQHHSINQRVDRQKGLYILTDKIISARRSILVIFHYRGPHGAGMARDHHIGEEFAKFQRIRLRLDGAHGS